ncbi:MAG TPA: hypothetical protein VF187_11240 [Gemmatimonadales bacterium]
MNILTALTKTLTLVEEDVGYGRVRVRVVDPETGEVMLTCWHATLPYVFSRGASSAIAQLIVSREVADGAELVTVSDPVTVPGQIIPLYQFWHRPEKGPRARRPRGTGGKRKYVRVYDEAVARLDDEDAAALLRLARLADWETGVLLLDGKPADFAGLLRYTGYSRATLRRRLASLAERGAVLIERGQYRISGEYVRRG